MSAKSFLEEAGAFRKVRSENWKGPTSRGGRRHAAQSSSTTGRSTAAAPTADAPAPAPASAPDLWQRLVVAAGSDRQAEVAVASMQRHLLEMVENMPMDEIDQLAGE